MNPDTALQAFLEDYPPAQRELALRARGLIQTVMPETIEQLDPSANLIAYGLDRTYRGLICGITIHRDHVNLMFARGAALPDPHHRLSGTGKKARHVRIQQPADLEAPGVRDLLEAARRAAGENNPQREGDRND